MLEVVVCCDVDHDIPGYNIPAIRFDVYKQKLGWKSINNIQKIREICNSVKDSVSNGAKITWFIRSDEQLKTIFNNYAFPLRNFWSLWKQLRRQGHEIAWHPHLWRWSNKKQCWYQEVSNKKWISHCLENGYKEFVKLAKNVTSVRMGWGFHNNFTMRKINDLGLIVDLSAAPGLEHMGGPDKRGSHFLNEYDWSTTPNEPYHPSEKDYRRPSRNNDHSLEILEIPLTTAPKSKIRILSEEMTRLAPINLRKKILRGADIGFQSVQHKFIANVTQLSFRNIAKQKLKEAKQNAETNTNLITVFHPIELFRPKAFMNLQINLMTLTELCKKLKVPFRFLTATEMARELLFTL